VKGETSLNPLSLSFSNPRLPGTSPLGLASLNRKDLPIVVTLGGVGPCYTSLAFYFIASAPSYKLCDNKRHPQVSPTFPYYHCTLFPNIPVHQFIHLHDLDWSSPGKHRKLEEDYPNKTSLDPLQTWLVKLHTSLSICLGCYPPLLGITRRSCL
jgi:hypothetical protein